MFLLVLLIAALGALLPDPASAAPPYLGVQVHSLWNDPGHDQTQRELRLLGDLGVGVARVDVGWASLQGSSGEKFDEWYVERMDAFVAGAAQRGVKVIATLTETPCWASSAPAELRRGCDGAWWERGAQDYPPRDPRDYARAARFLTARYGTQLAALEIWNEPNLPNEFITSNKAQRYAALVRATYPEAKAGHRRVPVIVGSTSHADASFLRRVYAAGIRGAHDGISLHPYSDGRDPLSTSGPAHLEFGQGIRLVRRTQVLAGQRKPLWLTEFGYTACAGSRCVTEADQARLIAASVRALPEFPYVRAASLYQLRDTSTDRDNEESNFGLVRESFAPRPAYWAFKAVLAEAAAQRP